MREATWLTTEEAETNLARREAYVLCPEFFRRAKPQTTMVLCGLVILACVFALTSGNPNLYPLALLSIAVLSLGSIPLAAHWERRQVAKEEPDVSLREGFGKGPGQFVHLIVLQGDTPTGEDRGMLWIEDGRLYFSGHRTSFGLVPSQVGALTMRDAPIDGIRYGINLRLQRTTDLGPVSLSFELGTVQPTDRWERRHELQVRIERWRQTRLNVEGQWPPSELGPGVISDRRLLAKALVRTLSIPLLITLLLTRVFPGTGWVVFLGSLVVAIGMSQTDVRWSAVRGRRRLRRGR